MTRARVTAGAAAAVVLGLAVASLATRSEVGPEPVAAPHVPRDSSIHEALLYGRVTAADETVYQGRLRWGGDQEALWGSYFNGLKDENPWIAYAPPEPRSLGVLGVEIARWEGEANGERPFVARMGDLARIERAGRDILVQLKNGTDFVLDRMAADELGDGLRVWDEAGGVFDLREQDIVTVELLPAPNRGEPPLALYGTVRTADAEFTGWIAWDRDRSLSSDELGGLDDADAYHSVRFEDVQAIERRGPGSSTLTLRDGGTLLLSGTRDVGRGHRGLYVDDPRYGRVLVPWDAFERVDFAPGGSAPAYDDFPPGDGLVGDVTTRSGESRTGRLVFDLDESQTTETLDAPWQGVDYTVLFGLIASIELPAGSGPARVELHSGEVLQLERRGDLSDDNGGMLVFETGDAEPRYVPWEEVARIDLTRPSAMYPPNP